MSYIIESPTRETLPLKATAIVLCGGKSKRMGRPKAFLPYEGSTIIEHVLAQVRDLFAEVLLVANEPELYENLGVDVVKDILPHRGPLGGILSGLLTAGNPHAFVVACDMPLIEKRLIREMTALRHGNDVVVLAHDQGIEPLFALYSKNCIKPLEEALFAGSLSLQDFLQALKAEIYRYEPDEPESDRLPPFFNINTPQDYSKVIMGGANKSLHHFPQRTHALGG